MRVSIDAGLLNVVKQMLLRNSERFNNPSLKEIVDEINKDVRPIDEEEPPQPAEPI